MGRSPCWWDEAIAHLVKVDACLASIIDRFPDRRLVRGETPFSVLVSSIIGQQISVHAASAIRQRIAASAGWQPQAILDCGEGLKRYGLSSAKTRYLCNVAEWFVSHAVDEAWFEKEDNATIGEQLMAIKGIGPWTWQMFQIFYLLEPHILPVGDLGFIKGIEKCYDWNRAQVLERLPIKGQQWSPYGTAATWFLWVSLDSKGINY